MSDVTVLEMPAEALDAWHRHHVIQQIATHMAITRERVLIGKSCSLLIQGRDLGDVFRTPGFVTFCDGIRNRCAPALGDMQKKDAVFLDWRVE